MIRDAHLLVTGGAGFIGTALTRRLAPHNRIRVLDNLRRNALAEAGLADHPNVELVVGDVRDAEAVAHATRDVDYVVHMASIAGVDTVMKNPVTTMEVSIEGTLNVLRAALASGRYGAHLRGGVRQTVRNGLMRLVPPAAIIAGSRRAMGWTPPPPGIPVR